MGIFSSKYKTTVGTSVTRVIDDDQLPNSIRTGVLKNIINNDDQMLENAMEEMTSSIAFKANRMYNYAAKNYPQGLPSDSLISSFSGKELVTAAISEENNATVSKIDYYNFGPLNNLHFGWIQLIKNYLYNPATNTFYVNGKEVYLVDMVVVVQDASLDELANGSLDQWGISPKAGVTANRVSTVELASFSVFETNTTTQVDYLRVEYNYEEPNKVIKTEQLTIPVNGIDVTKDYHHVKYQIDGDTKYWLYRNGDGQYPAIDRMFDTKHKDNGSYFPFGYFRYGKVSYVNEKTWPEYGAGKRLTNYLGLDFDTVGEAIDENEDIDDVEQAMLMMAVPVNTTNQIEARYIYDYMNRLYQSTGGDANGSKHIQDTNFMLDKLINSVIKQNAVVIQDKRFKLTLIYRKITKKRVSGSIGDIGTYTSSFQSIQESVPGKQGGVTIIHFVTPTKVHYFRKQITPNVYEELCVEGLKLNYHIFEDYYETADETEDILMIPVDRSITDSYSIMEREELYSRSLHYVFNSRVITKIKWYQRGAFKTIMIIVAVVVTILSLGKAFKTIALAASIGASATAIAVIVIQQILIRLVMALALKLFVKLVGAKLGFIAAIVALVAAAYSGYTNGSLEGAPFAEDLVSLSSGLSNAASKQLEDDFNALKTDYDEFVDLMETEQERLDKAKDELTYNNYLTPTIIFGETPTEYYDRTIHSGNIGTYSIDAVSNYVDIALRLPKLTDSLGDL